MDSVDFSEVSASVMQNFWSRLRCWLSPRKESLGARGESLAAEYLQKLGWKLLARNHRNRLGEIDLIARDGSFVVFVEVRSRSCTAHGNPVETISADKQRRLTRAATLWLKSRRLLDHPSRFDVITIVWGQTAAETQLQHYRDAFTAGL